ncbi:MAG TPA: AsmA family protein, partial [Verrucomicrobiae bacterium]|nr:AsmA family protein [Verrucomicrobiae bacterium]
VNKATIARQNEPPTPALDLHSDYQVTVNRNDNSALLQTFNLNGTQNQQPLLHADLASPMNFSLGSGSNAKVGDSTLKCVVTNFNLADWKAALGDAASSGTMNMTLNLLSQQGGKQLTVDFNSQLANLTAKVGSNQLQQASMDLNGHLISQQENKALTGNVTLSDFNGTYENYRFQNYGTKVDLDIAMNKPQMEIKNISGTIVEGQNAGGSFKLSGNYNQNDKTGQLMLKLVDWNQNALRPFMGAFLGDKTLESVSLNSTTTANYASSGESSFKTDLQVTNLVVRDPKSQSPPTPLAANLQLDASLNKQVAQVRQLVLKLTPTDQAANNQITATGQLDLSQSNAIQGSLKLASDSLDVTRYYDLYSGKHNAAKPSTSNAAPPAPAQPQTAAANAEPPAKNLPIKNFTLDASIARLVLHEVNVSNFQTTARVEGSHAVLKPFQFSLNGGPVNATVDLDLGVPGYKYEMTFSGTNIPLAPLADTFSPEYKNNAKGEVFANLQIKGQGTTGASMQKTLSGQCDVLLTNANIQVVGAKSKKILTPIAAALKLPELLQSPITWLTADVTIGNGSIKITQFKAAGSAFSASSQGTVAIANVLSNSPIHDLPVNFALAGPLAAKARLMPSNANTNAAYVDLGKIATVQGTIGDPKTKVDYATIGLITARAAGGIIGGSTGNILKGAGGIGNLLNGQNPPANNQPNQSNTNQSQPNRSSGNPFDLLHKVLPK